MKRKLPHGASSCQTKAKVVKAGPRQQALINERTLYVAHEGRRIAAWWNVGPPERTLSQRKRHSWPKFSAPDVWHPECDSSTRQAIADLVAAHLLPVDGYRVIQAANEWAERGLRLAAAAMRVKRTARPDPEMGGLFAADDVKVTHHIPKHPQASRRHFRKITSAP